jgi:hypothetical protein
MRDNPVGRERDMKIRRRLNRLECLGGNGGEDQKEGSAK